VDGEPVADSADKGDMKLGNAHSELVIDDADDSDVI